MKRWTAGAMTVFIAAWSWAQDAPPDDGGDGDRPEKIEQAYTVEQMLFLPPEFYVGDEVEVRLRITTVVDSLPSEVEEIPDTPYLAVDEIRVIPIADEYEIRIRYAAYRPGELEIPAFALGDLEIGPIPFEVESIRQREGDRLRNILDPVLLPGTTLLIALSTGIVLFGPLLLFLSVARIRRVLRGVAFGTRRPYRALRRELEVLRSKGSTIGAKEFYGRLFDAFREYLSHRSEFNYRAATVRETERRARKEFGDVAALESLTPMVDAVDLARFGGGGASSRQRLRGLEIVVSAVEAIEADYRKGGHE